MSVRWNHGSEKVPHMIRTCVFEPVEEIVTEHLIGPTWQVADLIEEVVSRSSGRGHPAAEVIRDDGSAVTLGTDGDRAIIVWTDSLGGSYHSVGDGSGGLLVYDHFGSWSEAPSDWQVPIAHAIEAVEHFVVHGTPATERVVFQPD